MPQMGVSVAEGTIAEWKKRPGDWVEADETIVEVTTDKIDVEIPSPATGRLERILVEPGETVDVGTPLAEIDPEARPGEAHRDEAHPPKEAAADQARSSSAPQRSDESAPERGGDDSLTAAEQPSGQRETATAGAGNGELDRSTFYSPVVRRIAAEHGVDLTQVPGHGVGGRVRKKDLLAYIETREREAPAAEPRPLHTESPYRPEPEPEPAAAEAAPSEPRPAEPEPAAAQADQAAPKVTEPEPPRAPATPEELIGPTRREPLTAMRRQIARHMVESGRTSAHCTTVVEADFSAIAARRAELKERMAARGAPLTYLAFVARATVEALEEHPILNASIEGEEIVYHEDVNLGIAVALEQGLVVPVIRKAQRLSLEGIAAEIADLAKRARAGALEPDEVHGGTFTITNPGQYGALLATPIINQPQVAILDLEAVVKRPVVIEGSDGDGIAIRPMSYLCMSWDHRALDGVEAARFLSNVRERIETGGEGR